MEKSTEQVIKKMGYQELIDLLDNPSYRERARTELSTRFSAERIDNEDIEYLLDTPR